MQLTDVNDTDRTKVSIKGAISCLRRHKALSREIRKFKKNLINSKLLAIVQAWWLHSRTQTVGAKFLRAGEKSVNRVTGAAVNVTGVAVSAISYVNPANVLGAWSSPFSSPAPGPNVNVAGRRGSIRSGRGSEEGNSQPDSTARCLARNLPYTARTGPDYEGVSDSQDDAREASPAEALIGMMRDQLSNPQLIAASLRGLEQLASAPPAATPDAIRAEIAAKGKYEASTPPSSLLYRCSCR